MCGHASVLKNVLLLLVTLLQSRKMKANFSTPILGCDWRVSAPFPF